MTKKLYVVGLGPGSVDQMTLRAVRALEESQVIAGYTVYVELIKDEFPGKVFLTTPMKRELERCRLALLEADKGNVVAMVCSGDAGVYGMAGPVLELAAEFPEVKVEVIPGVTAACAGGAVLGAPIGHDFAVISLSDLLTPMEVIERRIRAAAMADMAICIYNPSSKKRADYLRRACGWILEYQRPETVCGLVRQIGREGESMEILTLGELCETAVDMFTTVFVGNSCTRQVGGRMVTPRGYRHE